MFSSACDSCIWGSGSMPVTIIAIYKAQTVVSKVRTGLSAK